MKDRTLTALALLIIAQRLLFIFFFSPVLEPDSGLYIGLGQLLSYGLGFDSAVRLPGYPALLAVCYRLFGPGQLSVVILQHALAVGLFFALRALLPDRRSKIIFSLLFFCDMLYASYQHAVLPETLFSFCLCLSAAAYGKFGEKGSFGFIALCGLFVAAGLMIKPALKYFPFFVLPLFFFGALPARRRLAAAAVFLAIPLAVSGLWSWRNYNRAGEFSTLSFSSLHYVGRIVSHAEFPAGSPAKEYYLKYRGEGPVGRADRGRILYGMVDGLRREKGWSDARLGAEFAQVYRLSIMRHPVIFARESAVEMFYFFFSAHNLYAKYALKDWLPFSVTEGLKQGRIWPTVVKVVVSQHPFYWALFLLTLVFPFAALRSQPEAARAFCAYALALIAYITLVTSLANEGLAIYRCPLQPLMIFCSALVLSEWFSRADPAGAAPK